MAKYNLIKTPNEEYAIQKKRFFGLIIYYWDFSNREFDMMRYPRFKYNSVRSLDEVTSVLKFLRGDIEIIDIPIGSIGSTSQIGNPPVTTLFDYNHTDYNVNEDHVF